MNALEIKILPDAQLLPAVLAAVRSYAQLFFKDPKDAERIVLATEEAVGNVLSYSLSGRMKDLTVTALGADGEFTVCVLDRGMPGNYEETLQGEDRLGLTLMQNAVDAATVENLGVEGRCQRLVKYYSVLPELEKPAPAPAQESVDNAQISVRTPLREEMVEISRLFYREYALTYPHEIVYYPDRFFAAVEKDEIHSTVAVDENGNVAGHHAVREWANLPGVWESGMAVVNGNYRNAGVFQKMMQRTYHYIHDEIHGRFFLGCCVTSHPYSQKLRLRYGSFPCGFGFNLAPPDLIQSTFKGKEFTSDAYACSVFDDSEQTVWLPDEVIPAAEMIYAGLGLPRTICTEAVPPVEEASQSSWAYNGRLVSGNINFSRPGADYRERLRADIFQLKDRGVDMIELYLPAQKPGLSAAYEAAKAEGFFFTALFPCTDQGDMLVMQNMLTHVVDYSAMVTVEPFTTLLGMIRKLDPDQRAAHQTQPEIQK